LILTPTSVVANEVRAIADCKGEVRVLPWGLDHSAPPSGTGRAANRPYFVYVGQARRHKGIDDLIVAFRASAAWDAGVPMVFVGDDFRDGSPAALRVFSQLGAAARPVGAVTDAELQRIVLGARALVHLSEREGFGFTPLEALRCGIAVVVRDLPVLRETLDEFGTFVGSTADAANAVDALLTAPPDAERVERGRRWVARYTWSRCAEELHEIYQALAA
jgi:glycosyltransferase involved in cell wall biosynthesis